jgi:hypothetical protein
LLRRVLFGCETNPSHNRGHRQIRGSTLLMSGISRLFWQWRDLLGYNFQARL